MVSLDQLMLKRLIEEVIVGFFLALQFFKLLMVVLYRLRLLAQRAYVLVHHHVDCFILLDV